MNRANILETTYEVIKDSLEWADSYKEKYCNYIDGVMTMTDYLLVRLEKENEWKCEPVIPQE